MNKETNLTDKVHAGLLGIYFVLIFDFIRNESFFVQKNRNIAYDDMMIGKRLMNI